MPKKNHNKEKAALLTEAALRTASRSLAPKKKDGKKKKKGFSSFLSGAAKIAADLAPAVLPILMAQHPATMSQMASIPQGEAPMVGTAAPTSLQPMTGITKNISIMKDGKCFGVKLCGMEYVGQITDNSGAGWTQGDKMFELNLNPMDAGWAGTRLQVQAHTYERWRMTKCVVFYQPASASTINGQAIGYIDTDPTEPLNRTGTAAVQTAASHVGAETNQMWQIGAYHALWDPRTPDLYLDFAGTDIRWVSAGTLRVLAATDIPAVAGVGSFGDIYVAYEAELSIPDVANATTLGGGLLQARNSVAVDAVANNDFIPVFGEDPDVYGSLAYRFPYQLCDITPPAAGSPEPWGFTGIPVGNYIVSIEMNANVDDPDAFEVPGINCQAFALQIGSSAGTFSEVKSGDNLLVTFYLQVTETPGQFGVFAQSTAAKLGFAAAGVNMGMVMVDGSRDTVSALRGRSLQDLENDFQKQLVSQRHQIAALSQRLDALTGAAVDRLVPVIEKPKSSSRHTVTKA